MMPDCIIVAFDPSFKYWIAATAFGFLLAQWLFALRKKP